MVSPPCGEEQTGKHTDVITPSEMRTEPVRYMAARCSQVRKAANPCGRMNSAPRNQWNAFSLTSLHVSWQYLHTYATPLSSTIGKCMRFLACKDVVSAISNHDAAKCVRWISRGSCESAPLSWSQLEGNRLHPSISTEDDRENTDAPNSSI